LISLSNAGVASLPRAHDAVTVVVAANTAASAALNPVDDDDDDDASIAAPLTSPLRTVVDDARRTARDAYARNGGAMMSPCLRQHLRWRVVD
jgi:hypothetical protein